MELNECYIICSLLFDIRMLRVGVNDVICCAYCAAYYSKYSN